MLALGKVGDSYFLAHVQGSPKIFHYSSELPSPTLELQPQLTQSFESKLISENIFSSLKISLLLLHRQPHPIMSNFSLGNGGIFYLTGWMKADGFLITYMFYVSLSITHLRSTAGYFWHLPTRRTFARRRLGSEQVPYFRNPENFSDIIVKWLKRRGFRLFIWKIKLYF